MSVVVWSLVLEHFPTGGPEFTAMLVLADYADKDGGNIYPSIAAFAKRVRRSEDQARRILHTLINEGFLHVVGNADGGKPGTTRHYLLDLNRLRACTNATPTACADATRTPSADASPTGGIPAGDPLHPCSYTPCMDASLTVTLTNYEGVRLPRSNGQAHPAAKTRRPNATPCPEDFRLSDDQYAWAKEALSFDVQRVDLETEEFLNWARSKAIRRADWPKAWKDSLIRHRRWEMSR